MPAQKTVAVLVGSLRKDSFNRKVANALVWKALGGDSDRAVTRKALLAHIVGRRLEMSRVDGKDALVLLATHHLGGSATKVDALRKAVARRWLESSTPPAAATDLATFATRVNEAARGAETGRFGDNKVFISHAIAGVSCSSWMDTPCRSTRRPSPPPQG